MDMEEDAEILATLLQHIPSCMNANDIEQLLQDIPVQPPVVVPVRTVQEAVAAGDIPPLDVDAAEVFSKSERILQEHVRKHGTNAAEVTPRSHTASRTISVLETPPPTRSGTGATAAGSTR